jgi:hypothetical protein
MATSRNNRYYDALFAPLFKALSLNNFNDPAIVPSRGLKTGLHELHEVVSLSLSKAVRKFTLSVLIRSIRVIRVPIRPTNNA